MPRGGTPLRQSQDLHLPVSAVPSSLKLVSEPSNSMFGVNDHIFPSWPALSKPPILQLFGWGTLAHSAFESNRHLVSPAPLLTPYLSVPACPHCLDPYAPLDSLLVLHVRRGDFVGHCAYLAQHNVG